MNIKRDRLLNQLIQRKHNGMIKVITGMRRAGKSFLLFNLFRQHLMEVGVHDDHIIALSLDDYNNQDYCNPDKLYAYVKNRLVDSGYYYILLDEIQLVEKFESVLNGFLHIENVDVYVTGSNAKFLSKDIITEFRGRGDEVRVHPLTFAEYLSVQPEERHLEESLLDYMTYGGLPKVVLMPSSEQKMSYLTNLYKETYLKDIKERYSIENEDDLDELLNIIASTIGGCTNIHTITNTFRSVKGSKICDQTVKNYITYIEDAFLIEKAARYDIKGRKYISTPTKYYFDDLGLRNARLNFRQVEPTHLMENLIYNELRNKGFSIDVGSVQVSQMNAEKKVIRNQYEVDFVCNMGYERIYIQSAYRIDSEEKMQQELKSMGYIKDGFKKIVIVGGLQPTYQREDGILILNLFDFLKGVKLS